MGDAFRQSPNIVIGPLWNHLPQHLPGLSLSQQLDFGAVVHGFVPAGAFLPPFGLLSQIVENLRVKAG